MADSGVKIPLGTGSDLRVRRQDVAGLTLTEEHCSNEVMKRAHSHTRSYFEVILNGAYTEHENRSAQQHQSLSVAFQPIVEAHATHIHPEGLHCLKVEMNTEWLERILDGLDRRYSNSLNAVANFANGPLPWLGVRLYAEWQRMDAVSPLAIEGMVLEMIAEATRCRAAFMERKPPRWFAEAEDLLHAEFARPLTLEYIAQTVGVHPVYLARVFRQQRRCTVGDYLRRLRIEHACRAIASSDVPLADIALAAGFADQSHFSRVFKRIVGLSPAAFRNCCSASSRIEKT